MSELRRIDNKPYGAYKDIKGSQPLHSLIFRELAV
jgi:hypothetical protein